MLLLPSASYFAGALGKLVPKEKPPLWLSGSADFPYPASLINPRLRDPVSYSIATRGALGAGRKFCVTGNGPA